MLVGNLFVHSVYASTLRPLFLQTSATALTSRVDVICIWEHSVFCTRAQTFIKFVLRAVWKIQTGEQRAFQRPFFFEFRRLFLLECAQYLNFAIISCPEPFTSVQLEEELAIPNATDALNATRIYGILSNRAHFNKNPSMRAIANILQENRAKGKFCEHLKILMTI